jgi:3-deoxy-D-manno-octulosonic-acid transferase
MMRKITSLVIALIYDVLVVAFLPLALLMCLFAPRLRQYLFSRANIFSLHRKLKSIERNATWFCCSSIGDLEQTLPLIKELQQRDIPFFLFFHSPNGYRHAASLGYSNISFCPVDMFMVWVFLSVAHKPAVCIINRHDFWPGFIAAASLLSKLYIINAVQKNNRALPETLLELWVYGNSRKVFFVNNIKSFTSNEMQAGDTRADRLLQRYLAEEKDCSQLRDQYKTGSKKILVMGNGYPDDMTVLCGTLKRYPGLLHAWKFIIVPSRPEMAGEMKLVVEELPATSDITVVPVMGKLFQYYAIADLAWVGGGFSPTGIHNTLEPSFYGISLVSGPNLNNQPDALAFLAAKLLNTFTTPAELHQLLASTVLPAAQTIRHEAGSPTARILKEIY